MLLFHGSGYNIKEEILPHQAQCSIKSAGNMVGVYCSNDCTHAFVYTIIKNKKSCDWSYDGRNTILTKNDVEINEYGYMYFIYTSTFEQISKKQFLLTSKTKYLIKKKIYIPFFIDIEENIINIHNDDIKKYIFFLVNLYSSYVELCEQLGVNYNIEYFNIICEFMDCQNDEFFLDKRHGYEHSWRTAIYALIIYQKDNIQVDKRKLFLLLKSVYYHDIGRYIPGVGQRHGMKGKFLFREKYKKSKQEDICENLICNHDIDININNTSMDLLEILHDADAIDRLRFELDAVRIEKLYTHGSLYLYNAVRELYFDIYQLRKENFYMIPLAYGGPCIAENGPLVLAHEIRKNPIYHECMFETFDVKFDESVKDYFARIKNVMMTDRRGKCIFIGGNHLSMLPIYYAANERGYLVVVFDAHRDFKSEDGVSHANFMKYAKENEIIIYGYRDEIDCACPTNIVCFKKNRKKDFMDYVMSRNKKIYIDIDIDVIEPNEFSSTYSTLANGISIYELSVIIHEFKKNIQWISISEYVPILDNKKNYLLIERMLTKLLRGIDYE